MSRNLGSGHSPTGSGTHRTATPIRLLEKEELDKLRVEKMKWDEERKQLKRELEEKDKELLDFKSYRNAQATGTVIPLVMRLENVAAEASELRESLRVSESQKAELQRVLVEMKCREEDWSRRIEDIEREKEKLDRENGKMMAELQRIRESYEKLEESVISTMCLDVKRDKKFSSSQIGKIMSEILNELDYKGSVAEEGGNSQESNSNTGPCT